MRKLLALVVLLATVVAGPVRAGHHSWDFTEIYSNASGSVQFVELFCPVNGEAGLGPFGITCGANSMTFVTDLPGATANTWVLVATSNFSSLPGAVTPDYVLPANFFPTGGGTLNYAGGADVWAYGTVPTNGVQSLLRNGSTATNTPKNFAGQQGQVNTAVATPMLGSWGIVLLLGALLLAASGMLRRRAVPSA